VWISAAVSDVRLTFRKPNRNLKAKHPPVFGPFTTKAKAGGCFLYIAPVRVSGVSAPVPFERFRVSPQITILSMFLIAISFIKSLFLGISKLLQTPLLCNVKSTKSIKQ
jgi:hypothetical protein